MNQVHSQRFQRKSRKNKISTKKDTWCTVSVNDVKTTVLVRHLGGGKFKVIDDRSGGNLIGKILDAWIFIIAEYETINGS